MREKSLRFAELAQVESPVDFPRKRGLPSSIKTKAGQVSLVVICVR